jgi:hypothetical protein
MSKMDPTLAEAIDRGIDCSAFAIFASVNPFYAVGAIPHDEHALGFPIACEERTPDPRCRKTVPEALHKLSFRIVANERASPSALRRGVATDAIHIANASSNPECSFVGFHTLVSARAREAIESVDSDECVFIRTELQGVDGDWSIMWIKNVVDAVDLERSNLEVLSWRDNGDELLRPKRLFFKELEDVKLFFRLPQWRYFRDDDLCTNAFRELVEKFRLTGFSWITGGGTGPFLRPEPKTRPARG